MRFLRLQIPAYGPFTNLDLQFSDRPDDLHVIYGHNEAGKSSLLRAIRDLLFGIHVQSTDGFLHDYADLKIKGEIRNRAGQQMVFQRRKGNKNTLLDADGQPLPENALVPFLGSVDRSYFSAMFGLGVSELREGAQELLRGEGDIGSALFSASMGGTPIQKVVEALQQEADSLFKGRAITKVSIRPAAARYKELLKLSREAMVNPETWERIERELAQAEAEKQTLEAEISKLDSELQWISRCEDALPTVGRLGEAKQRLADLPALPDLSSDFASRAQSARQGVNETLAEVHRLTANIDRLRNQLQGCQAAPVVLAEADNLDSLHQELGAYRTRKKELGDLQSRLAELEPSLRAGMLNLSLTGEFSSLEGCRLSSPLRLACQESAAALKAALAEQATNSVKTEGLQNQIRIQESQLDSVPEQDLTDLREALAVAAEATEADRTRSASESEVRRWIRETADQHHQLAGAPADSDATARLPVPAITTIRRHQEGMEAIKRDIVDQEAKLREANSRVKSIQAELGRLQRRGELPSEDALLKARAQRDHGWSLVLAEWKGNGATEELIAGTPLEEAFPRTITQADAVADRLRLDADAVAKAEEKRSQLDELGKHIEDIQQRVLELRGALEECQISWRAEWAACGITPQSPAEMLEWRDRWSEFRERLTKLKTAQDTLQIKNHQVQQAKDRLSSVLGRSRDEEFSLLFAAARTLVQEGERSAGMRETLADQLGELRRELTKLDQSRVRLGETVRLSLEQWKRQCVAVGLPDDTSPDAGLILLQERKDLLGDFDEWRQVSSKYQSTVNAITQYEQEVRVKALALGVAFEATESAESALWRSLTEARKAQTRHDQLTEQIEHATDELLQAQGRATESEHCLQQLLELAGLGSVAELESLLANLEHRNAALAQIEDLQDTLRGLARGQIMDEFVSRVRVEKPEVLAERRSATERAKAEKESILPAIRETLFRLRNEKTTVERAGDAAADYRQQAESCAASLKQDAARYLRLRLATYLLQSQIEQFRKENQGPLLQKSGEVFHEITRGAFSGLAAEFTAEDVPTLVGVRPDDTKVSVSGLSDGSRDQLFLALRLAALDRYLGEHEPMPLILDDLLITFDDQRAKAILPRLKVLAQRTQIVLFTHHHHLVDLCRQTLREDQFHLHYLGNAA